MRFSPLLTTLGIAALKGEVDRRVQRVVRQVAFGAATGFFALLAVGFGLAALTVWIAGELGVIPALCIVAGGALAMAIIVQIVAAATNDRPARRPVRPLAEPVGIVSERPAVAENAEEPPQGAVAGAMALVAAAGFLLARQLFRRRPPEQ